jgi:site-specific recombinase XerD
MNALEQSRFDRQYQQHLTALKLRGCADATIDSYARAVRRIAGHFGRSPDALSAEEFKTCFSGLVDSHSWSTVKVDLHGLRFFYTHALKREWPWVDLIRPPVVHHLPDVLTYDEIARLILGTAQRRYQTFWLLAYSTGLRLSEALSLQVSDIDAQCQQVHVRDGKGRKDRFVFLPGLSLRCLRRLWRDHRHPKWIFPGSPAADGRPAAGVMDAGSTQKAFARVVADCGLRKKVSIHSLRHAYATHLVEAGLNLRNVQTLLGHACPRTTVRYVHMTDAGRDNGHATIEGLMAQLDARLRAQRGA